MNHSVTATRRATTVIVTAVGLFAAGDSYTHIYSLARSHQQSTVSAALLPLAGDGLVLASSWVMLMAAKKKLTVPLRARVAFWGGVMATSAANAAYGLPHGATAAMLSLWPVAAYLGCMEMLTWMQQHLDAHPVLAGTASADATVTLATSASAPAPAAAPAARQMLPTTKPRQPLHVLLATAEARFSDVRDGGKIPGLRDIQAALGVGQPKAQTVQAHLKALQA